MKRFVVIVRDRFENEHSRHKVESMTHRDAVNQVRGSRQWWHWPIGATFTPRLVGVQTYQTPYIDSGFGPLSLPERMPG